MTNIKIYNKKTAALKMLIPVLIFAVASILTFTGCSKKNDSNTNPVSKTFVLVHGSFQGPYAWQYVKAELEQAGQKVIVVELPGHGQDQTPPATLTLNSYRDKVIAAINTVPGQVVLVGHSLGGAVITAVADSVPNRIERLVYLAGFVPANGQSVIDLNSMDPNSQLTPALMPSADHTTASVADSLLLRIFCQDGNATVNQLLIANNRPEPAAPLYSKIVLKNPAMANVPKYYIHTTQDRAITISLQNQMVAAAGIKNIYTINSSHSPHLSMPDQVTAILLQIIK
jgi:pimeloyl-ACP methyl ester carboxylesterase